ncbi:unnamed protein product [Candidula unifasciata]|uniref:Superoxide dismutase copper/zinc binding domain-containing protein n=1 Tax=Candidula unifasciata TaxID=100452 RepID=A0A8S3ZDS2_9EUPU|nr:unnamed protein product [Candidula unifasciata]
MRKTRLLVCCGLVLIALLVMTSIDAKKTPKNKKLAKNDLSKNKSTKSDSKNDEQSDMNPKMKPMQNKPAKKKPDKKIGRDSKKSPDFIFEHPEESVAEAPQEKVQSPDVKDGNQTAFSEPSPLQNCSTTASNSASDTLENIEKNVTSLWRHLRILSQPVHIHVHGGQASSAGYHGDHGCRGRVHGDKNGKRNSCPQNCKDKLGDKEKHHHHSPYHHHDHTHNDSHDHSIGHHHHHGHAHRHAHSHRYSHPRKEDPKIKDNDTSGEVNTTASEKDHSAGSHNHTHGHGDRSHKSHQHNSKDKSKSHSHSSKSHSHSSKSHSNKQGDRSHKPHNHYKHHSHGNKFAGGHDYSLPNDNYHKGHYSFRDRSTHVHIHLTLDEKPLPVQGERNDSESSTAEPVKDEPVFARCDFRRDNNLSGYVLLRQSSGGLDVKVNISGFDVSNIDLDHPEQRLHGFHVHEFGDFSNGCLSFGSHYNPEGTTHGGLTHEIRHVGDWGNIEVNDQGEAVTSFSVKDASLLGPHSILGRGIVVHELLDDLGEGGVPASKTTGNAGGRLACCIIGYSKPLPAESFQQTTVAPSNSTTGA